jgi:hypothetical protein
VSFTFSPGSGGSLLVGVQSINFSNSTVKSQNLLAPENGVSGIYAAIDSTITELWLPTDTCNAFASAFGLQFDELDLKYTITPDNRQRNINSNASLSFQLGPTAQNGPSTFLTFPYEAFDKIYVTPAVKNGTLVFPLRQAQDVDQYILGRTFLQEAFLTVDYEHQLFNVSQTVFGSAKPDIVAIGVPSAATTSPASPGSTNITVVPNSSGGGGLSNGAIAGIAIGVSVVGIIVAVALLFVLCRRYRKKTRIPEVRPDTAELPTATPHELGDPPNKNDKRQSTLSGETYTGSPYPGPAGSTKPYQSPVNSAPAAELGAGEVELEGSTPAETFLPNGSAWHASAANHEPPSPHTSVISSIRPGPSRHASDGPRGGNANGTIAEEEDASAYVSPMLQSPEMTSTGFGGGDVATLPTLSPQSEQGEFFSGH